MDFIKRFHFIQKFKDNHSNNSTSLERKKSKRSIFSHHNNDRHAMNDPHVYDDEQEEEDEQDEDDYNSNTLIFHQKPLHAITITATTNKNPTSKTRRIRPTNQLYMHHHKNSSSTVQSQLLSLSTNPSDIQPHKQLSIAFEGEAKPQSNVDLLPNQDKSSTEQLYHHKQEKLAMRHSEKVSFNDSTLYAPFIQRPEIVENDYIPLPTVTRKYIDPPSDVLLNSIPSFHLHKKTPIQPHSQDDSTATTATTLPSPTATVVAQLKKPKHKLVVDTKRLDDASIADIGTWLSRNVAMETNDVDMQQSIPKSTTF